MILDNVTSIECASHEECIQVLATHNGDVVVWYSSDSFDITISDILYEIWIYDVESGVTQSIVFKEPISLLHRYTIKVSEDEYDDDDEYLYLQTFKQCVVYYFCNGFCGKDKKLSIDDLKEMKIKSKVGVLSNEERMKYGKSSINSEEQLSIAKSIARTFRSFKLKV